jgi:hypothetical protein
MTRFSFSRSNQNISLMLCETSYLRLSEISFHSEAPPPCMPKGLGVGANHAFITPASLRPTRYVAFTSAFLTPHHGLALHAESRQ